ncbi:SEC-C metal-binding domain-containing protein [Chryseobacterium carnipullorum]|uniref:SEC-C metal-binding domain-containing protein n=1 Tax=Chryseobacterium carnipullorum TaxID=1124835 RepID=UPI00091756D0|nr:SEC-C metal-binding domain-containing protein [Chryseobacterium carnipullorum]SHM93991.1 SEC-C motif-containing protein [Chryseobacterium carnipullorum]HBV16645.1 hypothetical protein [Chryseobacterium carnipullorum]
MTTLRPAKAMHMPAVCTNCGNIFNSERGFFRYPLLEFGSVHYEVLGATQVTGVEGTVGCPVCNGIANFRCDLFDIVDEMFQDLKRLGKPQIIYLKELLIKFSESGKSQADAEALRQNSESRGIMILGKFGRENVGELTLIATILGIVVSIILGSIDNNTKDQVPIDNSINIEKVYQVALKQDSYEVPNITNKVIPKNQPCPCGSKKKFKYCCGK